MKVGNLKEGMLLRPKVGEACIIREAPGQDNKTIGTIRFRPNLLNQERDTFMYLGCKKDSYRWDGVFKHHRVLFKGRVLHMSGYDVKDIEPVT